MKINWKTVLTDVAGKEINAENGEPLTLDKVAINALSQLTQQDGQFTGEEKFKLGELAYRVYRADSETEFEVEEIAKIKERIGKLYTPIAVFQAYNLLK
jgi:hypothetical protein